MSKYILQKADGSEVDPGAVYFVLRLDKPENRFNRKLVHMFAEQNMTSDPEASKAAIESLKLGHIGAVARSMAESFNAATGKQP